MAFRLRRLSLLNLALTMTLVLAIQGLGASSQVAQGQDTEETAPRTKSPTSKKKSTSPAGSMRVGHDRDEQVRGESVK